MSLSVHRIKRLFEKCNETASDSHDPNTQVGAVLIHKKTRSSVAEGFNGHIRKGKDGLPTIAPEKYRYMLHAEFNLICNAFRTGAVKYDPEDYILFCTYSPCEDCARLLHQCGIKEIYVEKLHPMFETYRCGTTNEDAAKDIEGIVKVYVPFPGGYQGKYLYEVKEDEEVLFYRIFITPKE